MLRRRRRRCWTPAGRSSLNGREETVGRKPQCLRNDHYRCMGFTNTDDYRFIRNVWLLTTWLDNDIARSGCMCVCVCNILFFVRFWPSSNYYADTGRFRRRAFRSHVRIRQIYTRMPKQGNRTRTRATHSDVPVGYTVEIFSKNHAYTTYTN